MSTRVLRPFDPARDSDGCTLAPWLSANPKYRELCVIHDRAYYYGGSEADKLLADEALRDGLIAHGMDREQAAIVFWAVQRGGVPQARLPWSWAFGGKRFQYDESPATPEVEGVPV